jgi:hypothetical protein
MERLKIAMVVGDKPKFDIDAFKYFILSLNKLQITYELFFPDVTTYPYTDKKDKCNFNDSLPTVERFIKGNKIIADYSICTITRGFDNNYFFNAGDSVAIITTDIWDKYFSPPSLFEYLMHCTLTCLIYSQKISKERTLSDKALALEIGSHKETKGCIADFTRNKCDDRIDILLGYICDDHLKEIKEYYGDTYLNEIQKIIDRKWIGDIDEKGSVAYNLKHVFRLDINKDSGFNKTIWDKIRDKFYEIPGDLTGEVLKVILTAFITFLLIKYGIKIDD